MSDQGTFGKGKTSKYESCSVEYVSKLLRQDTNPLRGILFPLVLSGAMRQAGLGLPSMDMNAPSDSERERAEARNQATMDISYWGMGMVA